jgi:ubiquinone/menaquinone biosynthesis C-methylase UbiE
MNDYKRLNLGSGTDIRAGWVNLDRSALPGVDVVHDIEHLPLPFSDESFDYVLCQDVLEHIDYVPLLRDIWRIMRTGASLHIRVPHFTSSNAYGDPTHKRFFNSDTFGFFVVDNSRSYYFDFYFARMDALRIHFGPRAYLLLDWFVNLSRWTQVFYEASPLRVFPASNVEVTLVK